MADAIRLGPFVLPVAVVPIAAALVATWLALRVAARRDRDASRASADGLTAASVAFLLVWKLTPLAIFPREILANPVILLRLPGGVPGVIAGGLAAGCVLAVRLWRGRIVLRTTGAVVLVAAVVFALAQAALTASAAGQPRTSEAVSLDATFLSGATESLVTPGTPTVLTFWATWCGPCRAELPVKARFHEQYGDRVRYVAVNMTVSEASAGAVSRFVTANAMDYPVALDPRGALASHFAVRGTPTTVVIDPGGMIVDRWMGPSSLSRLTRAVSDILAPR